MMFLGNGPFRCFKLSVLNFRCFDLRCFTFRCFGPNSFALVTLLFQGVISIWAPGKGRCPYRRHKRPMVLARTGMWEKEREKGRVRKDQQVSLPTFFVWRMW